LVPRQRSAPPLRQHGEPIVEPRGEALDAEYVNARGCQFERERLRHDALVSWPRF
jgi:hypothetical protein